MGNSLKKRNKSLYYKKGLSEIIAAIVTILLVLVAIGIVWGVVSNVIRQQTEQISLGKLTLSMEIKKVQIINSSFVQITVKRNQGDGNFTGIKFVFDDGDKTEIIEMQGGLGELAEKAYIFELEELNTSNLEKVSIAPMFILESGKETTGDIKDEHEIVNTNTTLISCTPNCAGKECGSDGCYGTCGTCVGGACNATGQCVLTCTQGSCAGKNCGSWANGTCAGTLNCGTCTGGQTCNATGICTSTCTDTCGTLHYNCGTWTICGVSTNCGTCTGGQTCNATGQCVVSGGAPAWQTGMISWWKFEGNANDYFGLYNGTVYGTLTYPAGRVGQGASGFSSSNNISINPALNYASTNMTLAFWMRITDIASPNRQNPIGKAYGGDGTITLEPSGQMNFFFGSSGLNGQPYTSDSSGDYATNGAWEHWVITRDRSLRRTQWYKNGIPSGGVMSYNSTYDPVHSNAALTIGDNYVNPLNGIIDELMIWNRTLNSTEVQQVYAYSG